MKFLFFLFNILKIIEKQNKSMKGKPQIQSAKERHEQPKWKDRTIVENNDMFCKFCHEKLN
jgi:hypothetical protein